MKPLKVLKDFLTSVKKMIPLFTELEELYNAGNLPESEYVVFFDSMDRQKLGNEYATWCVWEQFLMLLDLNKKWEERWKEILLSPN